jgi:cytochrome c553
VVWIGSNPVNCQLCHALLGDTMFDERTRMGLWANMCSACHTSYGAGIGQRYTRVGTQWHKTGDI